MARGAMAGLHAASVSLPAPRTPHGHWKTSTFVAGLRDGAITAPLLIDGAMNYEQGDLPYASGEGRLADLRVGGKS